jgi:hypothetical protein
MPGCDVTITAEFFKAEAKLEIFGQSAIYYDKLEEAFGGLGSGDEATITLLCDVDEQNSITVSGNVTLTAAPGAPKTISRNSGFTGSLFTVSEGASLVLDAGYSLGLTLNGKNISVNAPLVTVSGGALTMGGRVTLRNNNNSNNTGDFYGGGVYVTGNSTFNMSGGEINSNTAVQGSGGVYVTGSSTFNMSGGEISGNTAVQGGAGVYVTYGNNNKFTMSGNAVVKQDVYLANGQKIIVSDELTPPAGEYSAEIKLVNTANNSVVLEGTVAYTLSFGDAAKFKLSPSHSGAYLSYQNGKGILINAGTLGQAISSVSSGTTTTIFVQDNITVASSINVQGNVTLTVVDGLEATIERGSGNTGSLFTVNGTGASLTLDGGNGSLTLDGGKNNGITADAALVTVVSGGKLTMDDGVTLQNNNSGAGAGGGVYVKDSGSVFEMTGGTISGNNTSSTVYGGGGVLVDSGTFTMSGGTITGNTSTFIGGGGVYICNGGTFTMEVGTISWNTADTYGGGGVKVSKPGSKFYMNGGEIINNAGSYGGGVLVDGQGQFTMSDGTISGNESAGNGGGVNIGNTGSVFTMNGGTISGNKAACQGGGVYQNGAAFTMNHGTITGNTADGSGANVFNNGVPTNDPVVKP